MSDSPKRNDESRHTGHNTMNRVVDMELPHFRRSALNAAQQCTQRIKHQPNPSDNDQNVRKPLHEPRTHDQTQTKLEAHSEEQFPHGPPLPPPEPNVTPSISTTVTNFETTFHALLINLRALEDLVTQTRRLLEQLAETIQSEIAAEIAQMRREGDPENTA